MPKVTVYQVRIYESESDEVRTSRRMSTEAGAKMMGGWIVEDSGVEIDRSQLEHGYEWTRHQFHWLHVGRFVSNATATSIGDVTTTIGPQPA